MYCSSLQGKVRNYPSQWRVNISPLHKQHMLYNHCCVVQPSTRHTQRSCWHPRLWKNAQNYTQNIRLVQSDFQTCQEDRFLVRSCLNRTSATGKGSHKMSLWLHLGLGRFFQTDSTCRSTDHQGPGTSLLDMAGICWSRGHLEIRIFHPCTADNQSIS